MGTTCMRVTPRALTVVRRSAASAWPSLGARTMRAPAMSGANSSHTEASNDVLVRCRTTSLAVSGNSCRIQAMWLTTARCSTITPFGVPVDPDVYRT